MAKVLLKQLGIKTAEELYQKIEQAWAYCTKQWLKFQDRPGLHHTQRTTLKWYEEIQNGFQGAQGAEPLVRVKAVCANKKRLMQQANGLIIALHAISQEETGAKLEQEVYMGDCVASYINELERNFPQPSETTIKVTRKRSKYHREKPTHEKNDRIYQQRRAAE